MAHTWGKTRKVRETIFHKGRRPRRTIKSDHAKLGVRRLRSILVALVGVTVAFCAWSYRDTPTKHGSAPALSVPSP